MKNKKNEIRFAVVVFTLVGYLSLAFFAFAYLFLFPYSSLASIGVMPAYSNTSFEDVTASITEGDIIGLFNEDGTLNTLIDETTYQTGLTPYNSFGNYTLVESTFDVMASFTGTLTDALADENLCIDTVGFAYSATTTGFTSLPCDNPYVPPTPPYSQGAYTNLLPPFYGAPIASTSCESDGTTTVCENHYAIDYRIPINADTIFYFFLIFVISLVGTTLLIKHFT